ncbi:MATE family efflux transporter [Actinokineospora iranica]|uniref:Putative efflux protein, MATE family n=1 Tax=Actinokineospora iranica TaxID=1271860 RepID=A0A1G6KK75_9PSEU|nr:MATE family efflux transporter [Actinokineospora iranica]SDC31522.1 putative efflux protein, MATE family [Actinokineospora iranica]
MDRVPLRQVAGLALPALPVLAAEPLYLLVDTAVVGHLGGTQLGALGVGAIVLAQLSTQLTFLSYGTTARAARLHGAGRRDQAVAEGVQATWLALGVGVLLVAVGQLLARPVAEALAGPGAVADAAVGWLRIALLGVPLILVTLAGNGWMRGVQDTRRPLRYVLAGNAVSAVLCPLLVGGWGFEGSAVANVAGQVVAGTLFLRAIGSERVPPRPRVEVMRAQLVLGRDLVLRSLAFQACFVSATAVAARTSVGAVGAHQVVLQLWTFQALVLDSLAIAAQSLVGAALGAGEDRRATGLARQLSGYGFALGVVFAVGFAALAGVLPHVFTDDPVVLAEIPHAWWFFVALQPIAGIVFALDGVLLGAGDAKFLRTATLLAAVVGFLPLVWLSLAFGWGLVGIWLGLALFMVARLGSLVLRARSGRWAVVGAIRT